MPKIQLVDSISLVQDFPNLDSWYLHFTVHLKRSKNMNKTYIRKIGNIDLEFETPSTTSYEFSVGYIEPVTEEFCDDLLNAIKDKNYTMLFALMECDTVSDFMKKIIQDCDFDEEFVFGEVKKSYCSDYERITKYA